MPWTITDDMVTPPTENSLTDYTGGVSIENADELDGLTYRFLLLGDDGIAHYRGLFDREAFNLIDEGGDGSLTAALMLGAVVSGTTDLFVAVDDLPSLYGVHNVPTDARDVSYDGLGWRRII